MSACPHDRSKLSKSSRRARFRFSTALAVGRSVLTFVIEASVSATLKASRSA